ncbi:S-phase kinase-associated protein 1 [Dioscorea alata]|uniref:S-phase kinase-associated protein 1 n=1 Tax=Dioscorea alata TaxID=55571 RepID=A0ACB7WI34_DIOAL|nr:S-phase kinase-associated protein 1 [Dioscorea alata]
MAENMVTLRSKDNKEFRVKQSTAAQSKLLKDLIDQGCCTDQQAIPIFEVSSNVLQSLIEYCKKHAELSPSHNAELLKDWDSNFMKTMAEKEDIEFIGYLLIAANYLEVDGLLNLITTTVADMIRGKTPEEIRTILRIENDLTPEEEQAIRAANAWAFSD